ncbi:MAG: hypothetical protein KatS3mg068_0855 [Candidatus Sericytochromatia bacterium]|nr:MAG: hypothetical protein KatS3mg068_0855 [Candidatus Sericytochromatia bacterium]
MLRKTTVILIDIANPDNLRYIGNNILMIAEDTPYHFVPYAWAYNTK